MSPLRRYSYALLSVVVLIVIVVAGLLQFQAAAVTVFAFLGAVAFLSLAWVLLRRAKTPPNPEKRIRKSLGGSRPVVVNFYSDYCLICLARRPQINRLEKKFQGRVEFLFVSLADAAGCEAADLWEARCGDFLLFAPGSAQGERLGAPPGPDRVRALLETERPLVKASHRAGSQGGRSAGATTDR